MKLVLSLLFAATAILYTSCSLPIVAAAKNNNKKALTAEEKEFKCSLCDVVVDEIEAGIERTTQQHHVQSRFRMEEKQYIPYSRSEMRLMEILEDEIPQSKLTQSRYGVLNKGDRKGKIARILLNDGNQIDHDTKDAEPKNSAVDSSEAITKRIKKAYDDLLFGAVDDVTVLFRQPLSNSEAKAKLCVDLLKACPKGHVFQANAGGAAAPTVDSATPPPVTDDSADAAAAAAPAAKEEL